MLRYNLRGNIRMPLKLNSITATLLFLLSSQLALALPSAEQLQWQAAIKRLNTPKNSPVAIEDALQILRLFGALPPQQMLTDLEPVARKWLTDKKLASLPTTQLLQTAAVSLVQRLAQPERVAQWLDSKGAIKNLAWLGPFGDEHGSALARENKVELEILQRNAPRAAWPGRHGEVRWQGLPSGFWQPGARVDFAELVERPDDALIYVQVWIVAAKPGKALLHVNADGGLRIWLDGAALLSREAKPALFGIGENAPQLPDVQGTVVHLTGLPQHILLKLSPAGASLPLALDLTDLQQKPMAIESFARQPPQWQPVALAEDATISRAFLPADQRPEATAGLNWPADGKLGKGPNPLTALLELAWHAWPMHNALDERLLGVAPEDLPQNSQAALAHAMLAGELGDRIDRLRQWSAALPNASELMVVQADLLDDMGKTAQAHRLWQQWADDNRQQPENTSIRACLVRVELWSRLGAERVATQLLKRCADQWADVPELQIAMARHAAASDDLAAALLWQDRAAKAEPGILQRQIAALQAEIETGRIDALRAASIDRAFAPRSRAREVLALAYLAQRQPRAAQDALQGLPGHLNSVATAELRAKIAVQLKSPAAAVLALQSAIARAPARADLRTRLALLQPDREFYTPYRRNWLDVVKQEKDLPRPHALEQRVRHTVLQLIGNGQQARYDAEVFYVGKGGAPTHDLSIDYAPTLSRAEVLQAAVVHADGRVERNPNQQVEQLGEDASGMYFDLERITLNFKALKAGDAIIVEYVVRDLAPTPFGLVFGELLTLGETWPVRHSEIVVELPKDTPFYWEVVDPMAKDGADALGKMVKKTPPAEKDEATGWDSYTLAIDQLPAIASEERMPGLTDVVPHLHMSAFASWTAAAQWYAGLMAEAIPAKGSDPVLHDQAVKLAQGLTTTDEIVRAVYQYVTSQVRYVGLEFGIHSLKPHAVREILQRQFGDCKDKATLVVALLAELNINAQVALVRTRDEGRLHGKVASLGVFNHAIAYVPALDWWLDATATHHGPLELPSGDGGGTALRIARNNKENQGSVQVLPDQAAQHHLRQENIVATLQTDGSAILAVTVQLHGIPAADARNRLDQAQARKERLEQDLGGRFPGITVSDISVQGLDPPKDWVEVTLHANVPQWAQKRPDGLLLAPLKPAQPFAQWTSGQARAHDFVLDHAFVETHTLHLIAPLGFEIVRQPVAQTLDWPAGQLTLHTEQVADGLMLHTHLAVTQRTLPVALYPALRTWLTQVDAALRGEVLVAAKGVQK